MVKYIYIRIVSLFIIGFLFLKIYQTNCFIRKNYEKQRIDFSLNDISIDIKNVDYELNALMHYHNIKKWALEHCGMKPLKPSNLIVEVETGYD